MTVDLSRYDHFVDSVTSDTSKNLDLFVKRLHELENEGINPSLLIVIKENVAKLKARYPEGEFSVERSENRAEGDI